MDVIVLQMKADLEICLIDAHLTTVTFSKAYSLPDLLLKIMSESTAFNI